MADPPQPSTNCINRLQPMFPPSPSPGCQQSGGAQAKATSQELGSLTGHFHRGICQVALVSGGLQLRSPRSLTSLLQLRRLLPSLWEMEARTHRMGSPSSPRTGWQDQWMRVRTQAKSFHKGFSKVRSECRAWGFSATLDLNQKGFPQEPMLWKPGGGGTVPGSREKGGDPAKFLRPSGLTGSAGPEAELWLSQWEPVLACFLRAITPAPPPPVPRKPLNLLAR